MKHNKKPNSYSKRPLPPPAKKLSEPRRIDGRRSDELRKMMFHPNFVSHPEGSVLIEMGDTRVLCNVSIEDSLPPWMTQQGKKGGWVTAEYSMLPRATHTRSARESRGPSGRTQEIQRLIGRSLRAMINLNALGTRTCTIDCDVIQADGGTRTASINGACVALQLALRPLIKSRIIPQETIRSQVAAISVGIVDGRSTLDLCYKEDSRADVDMNVVMNSKGEFIEVQGTAESGSFPRTMLDKMLALSEKGIREIFEAQKNALRE